MSGRRWWRKRRQLSAIVRDNARGVQVKAKKKYINSKYADWKHKKPIKKKKKKL